MLSSLHKIQNRIIVKICATFTKIVNFLLTEYHNIVTKEETP